MRSIFSKNQGNPDGPGRQPFLFHRQRPDTVPTAASSEDQILEIVFGARAKELTTLEDIHIITTPPDILYVRTETLKKTGVELDNQKLTYQPENTVAVTDAESAMQAQRLSDALDRCDDALSAHADLVTSD